MASFLKLATDYVFGNDEFTKESLEVTKDSAKEVEGGRNELGGRGRGRGGGRGRGRGRGGKGGPIARDQFPPSELVVSETDCATCEAECDEHQAYPSYLDIDNDTKLLGSMAPYGRHILISTGQCDWPQHIEEEKDTLTAKLQAILDDHPTPWFTAITNTSHVSSHGGIDVMIQPENILLGNVSPNDAQLVYDLFVKMPLPQSNDQVFDMDAFKKENDLKELEIYPNPYKSMILICSHKRRDKRCGVTAPILGREFDHVLRELDIPDGEGGTAVMMVSHIGGHKFAGNVICYINKGKAGIWYGRVKSCHCRAIIEETIVQGKVIKELYRGSMKYSFGNPEKTVCERLEW